MQAETLRERLGRARRLFLDCDGVIFDSNGFKVRAMLRVLDGYPEALREEMRRYWRDNGGLSRTLKFQHFFENLAKVEHPKAHTEQAVERFGIQSMQGYWGVEPAPEALRLAGYVGRERTSVVSGADQDELRQVFRRKGIHGLFDEILGSPAKKLDLVRDVLHRTGVSPEAALFIGDGARDYAVCRELGIHFVYLDQFSEWDAAREVLSKADNVSWADDWSSLLEALGVP